jgi:hypothetical protein
MGFDAECPIPARKLEQTERFLELETDREGITVYIRQHWRTRP